LTLKNQSGVLRHTETIGPKKLVNFCITHHPVGGKINLGVTFLGKDHSLTRSQKVVEDQESLLVVSPQWTEQIEFSVQFENALDLKALDISTVDP